MEKNALKWLGHAFFKIYAKNNKVIYVDPWKDFPPGNEQFPKDEKVDDADIVLITHGHFDHLGDSVSIVTETSRYRQLKVLSNFEITLYLMEQGIKQETVQAMNKGGTVTVDGLSFSLVDARHSSGIGPFKPQALIEGGEAGGFVIKLEDGLSLYHTGDTDVFSDMELIAKRFRPQVVMLPIGGIFTMTPESAVIAVKMLKPKLVIPMHYGGAFKLPGDPQEFERLVKNELGDEVSVIIPKPGELIDLDSYVSA